MKTTKAVTYSLLAHIRNSRELVQGPQDIFKPLIKRAISHLNKSGVTKGKNVSEIAAYADKLYAIDFPLPVIRSIVASIANEVNTDKTQKFVLYDDGSFMMDNYLFDEFDEQMNNGKREIDSLETMFKEFCSITGHQVDEGKSILSFIDDNKQELSRYLAGTKRTALPDHTIEARFVAHFRDSPAIYGAIRNIYLGSILSNYVYYVPQPIEMGIELLFDTNFIVSLLDLNTVESTKSCNKLVEVCNRLGYKFSVLKETIDETRNLLMRKAEFFETAYLPRLINPEDIYNACERRKLSKVDLERIADKVEDSLRDIGCTVVFPNLKERNEAKWSREYTLLKSIRQSELGALHDTLAIQYVRRRRGKVIRTFEEAKCWFVNNANHAQYS